MSKGVRNDAARTLAVRVSALPEAGSLPALADVREGEASEDRRGIRPGPDTILAATRRRWDLTDPLPSMRPGWWTCGYCGGTSPVVRYWQFHVRPRRATLPLRCDVSIKCADCAALSVHGIAMPAEAYARRPRPTGIRGLLMGGSSFEPRIWAGGQSRG